jgi:hypothetical protein
MIGKSVLACQQPPRAGSQSVTVSVPDSSCPLSLHS